MVTLLSGPGVSSPTIHPARVALGLQGCVKGSYTSSLGINKDLLLIPSKIGGTVSSIHGHDFAKKTSGRPSSPSFLSA